MEPTRFTLATLATSNGPAPALEVNGEYFLLSSLSPDFKHSTLKDIFQHWDDNFARLSTIASRISTNEQDYGEVIQKADAKLLTPIQYPDKLLAVGANYSGHLAEMGLKVEKWPSMPFFMRPPATSLVGPGETVRIPRSTKQFDWECELAIVVGKTLRHATKEEAAAGIAGYTIGFDMSCRDLIPAPNELRIDLMRGKAQDTMAPCGPCVVPAQFLGQKVDDLRVLLDVNGKRMMDARTSEMLYKCDEILSLISEYMTLSPGDIVFTGSPSGSAGVHGGCWLQPGDVVSASIENIGALEVKMLKA